MREWLTPPVFDDEEKTTTARLLYLLLGVGTAVTLLITLPLALFQPAGGTSLASQGLGALLIFGFTFWCVRRGWVRQASLLLVSLFWLLNFGAVWQGGGLHALSFTNYVVIVFAAGLLLGTRAGIVFAGLTAAVGLGLWIAEGQGVLPIAPAPQTALAIWFSQVAVLVIVVALQAIASHSLRRALQRATTSEARYRLLFEESPSAVLITTLAEGTYLEVNEAFTRLTGLSREEVLGKTTLGLGLWVDMEERQAIRAELRDHGRFQNLTMHYRHKSGDVRVAQISGETIEINGTPCGLYTVTDTTDRLRAEQQINQYADLTWNMQLGMYVLQADDPDDDRTLRVIAANQAALRASEKTADQVLDKPIDEAFPSLRAKGFPQKYLEVIKTGSPAELEDAYFDEAGSLSEAYGVRVVPLSPSRLGVLFENITERRKAEEQMRRFNIELERQVQRRTAELEATNRELEAFTFSVSHDLRAPLRGVLGYAKLMKIDAGISSHPEALDHLERIVASAREMNELIDALLSISRLSRVEMHMREVDLSAMAEAVLDGLRASEPDRSVEIHVGPGLRARADEALMRSVLDNLLGNAWKYTSKQPAARIEFGAFPQPATYSSLGGALPSGRLTYFVRDNGPGFAQSEAERIFGVFQRLHTPHEYEGTGVGLAIVQRIIARHGGQVWAESQPDKGATFYFTLG